MSIYICEKCLYLTRDEQPCPQCEGVTTKPVDIESETVEKSPFKANFLSDLTELAADRELLGVCALLIRQFDDQEVISSFRDVYSRYGREDVWDEMMNLFNEGMADPNAEDFMITEDELPVDDPEPETETTPNDTETLL